MKRSPAKRSRYDWRPDLPDHRDHAFQARKKVPKRLSPVVDLAVKLPPAFDQGDLGSCTGNAMAAAFAFAHGGVVVSRLMAYYNARAIEGATRRDTGAQIRDIVKGMADTGACEESLWPYDIAKFANKPLANCYSDAQQHRIDHYQRLTSLDDMLNCLATGEPFIFGITVYASFESDEVAKTGLVPMPQPGEECLGGHAVCAVGYDLRSRQLKVRNSWGPEWGQQGHFMLPFDYAGSSDLADDFWVVRA